jgi:hypothetical protein
MGALEDGALVSVCLLNHRVVRLNVVITMWLSARPEIQCERKTTASRQVSVYRDKCATVKCTVWSTIGMAAWAADNYVLVEKPR